MIKRVINNPKFLLVAAVWCVYAVLFVFIDAQCTQPGINIWPYCMTIFSAATVFTLPLMWCSSRMRWSMWVSIVVTTIFVFVNIVYRRNFDSLLPLNSIFDIGNVDEMVFKAALDTIKWSDLTLLLPLVGLIAIWFGLLRKNLRGQRFSHKSAWQCTAIALSLWALMQCGATYVYSNQLPKRAGVSAERNISPLSLVIDKFRGKFANRIDYLLDNGMDVYLVWSAFDFAQHYTLDEADKQMIDDFRHNQVSLDDKTPIKLKRLPSTENGHHNLLIIMVESLETWALDYNRGGTPVLSYIDSLKNLPGSLYFPHLVSQASSGHSSDGHLLFLTGLLPLRESAAVTDFASNEYPSLIKAYKQKYGGKAYEIISDDPKMWNQTTTYTRYGFNELYDVNDIDTKHKTGWTDRDPYLANYVCNFIDNVPTPFALMAVTLSLHTPYRSKLSIHTELQSLDMHEQSIHYMQICKMDEECIRNMINALKNRGIYDNTVIIITGDHSAHGLGDKVRPKEYIGQEKYIPLLVLNSGYEQTVITETAGQVDIYPTLLDILGLENYSWRGVGLSLLRHKPSGATRRNFETVQVSDKIDKVRQNTAWKVSELLIRSNLLSTYSQ